MKSILLFIAIQLTSLMCFAQVDFPFVKEGAVWSESRFGLGIPLSYYHYGILGDSIIQDTTYKKVYIWQGVTADINEAEKDLFGLIREENQIVTFKHPIFSPIDTLFNANWEIGDSLGAAGNDVGMLASSKILSIDSILIDGVYRKRWNFYGDFSSNQTQTYPIYSYIDGIGTDRYTFFPATMPYFDKNYKLLCYEENGNQIYIDSLTSTCGFITNNHDINDFKNIQIQPYPNPTSHSFFIKNKTSSAHENLIQLFDFKGEMILEKTIHFSQNQSVKIKTDHLPSGIYFLKIENDDYSNIQKIIIQH